MTANIMILLIEAAQAKHIAILLSSILYALIYVIYLSFQARKDNEKEDLSL